MALHLNGSPPFKRYHINKVAGEIPEGATGVIQCDFDIVGATTVKPTTRPA